MDQKTLAAINLRAVLRTLVQLPALDPQAEQILLHDPITLQFAATGVTKVRLRLGKGHVEYYPGGGPADMKLAFPAPVMVNKMFDGAGAPIPTKGITKIKYLLGPFTKLTDRLSYYLRPTPELLADPEYARVNAILTLHVAAYATAEVGNFDERGRAVAPNMTDGVIVLGVADERDNQALTLVVEDHRFRVVDGEHRSEAGSGTKYAYMNFANLDTAGQVLRGELASYPAIGRELISLGGYIPLLDSMNKLLGIVPFYLS